MAPQIQLSPATFARLQKYAEPLVDDIESVINKIIDSHESKGGATPPSPPPGAKDYGSTPPNLTHTKVLSMEIGGKVLDKSAGWNGLLNEAILQAAAKLDDLQALKELLIIPHVI